MLFFLASVPGASSKEVTTVLDCAEVHAVKIYDVCTSTSSLICSLPWNLAGTYQIRQCKN